MFLFLFKAAKKIVEPFFQFFNFFVFVYRTNFNLVQNKTLSVRLTLLESLNKSQNIEKKTTTLNRLNK